MNPLVSCLCPTYGRYQLLRESLACFLAQDYEPKELVILNDHPVPLRCDLLNVRIINSPERYKGMGAKQNALLGLAQGTVGARWDDDDIYLPWHLSHWVPILLTSGKSYLRIRHGFSSRGRGAAYCVRRFSVNGLEAQHIYLIDRVRAIGYDNSAWRAESGRLIRAFKVAGDVHEEEGPPWCALVFGWNNGTAHVSARPADRTCWEEFGRRNNDHGNGAPLTPAPVSRQYRAWANYVLKERPAGTDYAEPLRIIGKHLGKGIHEQAE